MSYKEKDLTADFKRWLRKSESASTMHFSFVAEYKLKHNKKTLHLVRDFQPQQIPFLVKARTGCVYMKHSDMSMELKPYDATQVCHVAAYVAVCWHKPRQPKVLYFINASIIADMIEHGEVKLKEEMARLLAAHTITLDV